MITIRVNDQILETQKECNLLQVLQILQISGDGIAIAVNETIVLKSRWSSTTLAQNDTLLIIEATQGG
ncbi:sulfur carrier protein ThiS [Flavobacterium antarcticum]|uniref:sulfur carrier protein ThiS n=1 Tax=Flavobacterium antarcticum TaxID=271155 RepID=UPI0003B523EF|nr:sulfur carrier protein ThiS [Flavobacterium antarcticum]